jgi:hypothetical protein
MFKLSAEIDKKTLTIKVLEGKAFDAESRSQGYPFKEVVEGSHGKGDKFAQDTDSLQVAVRWSSEKEKDVGHATNALSADKVRENAAEWTFGGKKKEEWASWTTAVPDGATHLEVIHGVHRHHLRK